MYFTPVFCNGCGGDYYERNTGIKVIPVPRKISYQYSKIIGQIKLTKTEKKLDRLQFIAIISTSGPMVFLLFRYQETTRSSKLLKNLRWVRLPFGYL